MEFGRETTSRSINHGYNFNIHSSNLTGYNDQHNTVSDNPQKGTFDSSPNYNYGKVRNMVGHRLYRVRNYAIKSLSIGVGGPKARKWKTSFEY